jgi:hypothetical protein
MSYRHGCGAGAARSHIIFLPGAGAPVLRIRIRLDPDFVSRTLIFLVRSGSRRLGKDPDPDPGLNKWPKINFLGVSKVNTLEISVALLFDLWTYILEDISTKIIFRRNLAVNLFRSGYGSGSGRFQKSNPDPVKNVRIRNPVGHYTSCKSQRMGVGVGAGFNLMRLCKRLGHTDSNSWRCFIWVRADVDILDHNLNHFRSSTVIIFHWCLHNVNARKVFLVSWIGNATF